MVLSEFEMNVIKAIRHHQRQIDFHNKQLKKALEQLPPGEEDWYKTKEEKAED